MADKALNGKLIIVRHTESEWNASGRWTGLRDVHLSQKGFHEAALLGLELEETGIKLDLAVCSQQIRTLETLEAMLDSSRQFDVPIDRAAAINERDYGDYTGKNKWQMKELIGEKEFNRLRRGWDEPIPNGETLKMVYERVEPYYLAKILPLLKSGKNILLVAHGNSLRALIKYIENISDEAVQNLEMMFGTVVVYQVDEQGHKLDRQDYKIVSSPPKA
ncbi:MAG: 2,3-bisphosphoglycerate-dependent phosphoglycerate mutase [Candidatus Saccharimonadales bacterium]